MVMEAMLPSAPSVELNVSPVPPPPEAPAMVHRKLVNGQELTCRYAERINVVIRSVIIQFFGYLLNRLEAGVAVGEAQRVQLIDDVAIPLRPRPSLIVPLVGAAHSDDGFAAERGVLDLPSCWILPQLIRTAAFVKDEAIGGPRCWRLRQVNLLKI